MTIKENLKQLGKKVVESPLESLAYGLGYVASPSITEGIRTKLKYGRVNPGNVIVATIFSGSLTSLGVALDGASNQRVFEYANNHGEASVEYKLDRKEFPFFERGTDFTAEKLGIEPYLSGMALVIPSIVSPLVTPILGMQYGEKTSTGQSLNIKMPAEISYEVVAGGEKAISRDYTSDLECSFTRKEYSETPRVSLDNFDYENNQGDNLHVKTGNHSLMERDDFLDIKLKGICMRKKDEVMPEISAAFESHPFR